MYIYIYVYIYTHVSNLLSLFSCIHDIYIYFFEMLKLLFKDGI